MIKHKDVKRAVSNSMEDNREPALKKCKKLEDIREVQQGNILNSAVCSRGQKMVALAKLKKPELANNKPRMFIQNSIAERVERAATSRAIERKNTTLTSLRELDPSLLVKTSDNPIGSGTFRIVFLAEYQGIQVIIKEFK